MGIKVLTCANANCKEKVFGQDSFLEMAEKNGWEVVNRGTHKFYLCPKCSGTRKGIIKPVDPESKKSLIKDFTSSIKDRKKKKDKEVPVEE